MSDLIYVALVVGFFAVAVALVRACEHIIGPDDPAAAASATPTSGASVDPAEAAGVR